MEHTKGPWRVVGCHIACNDEKVIASCYKDDFNSVVVRINDADEQIANARLIASAPDMLSTLKGINDYITQLLNDDSLGYGDNIAIPLCTIKNDIQNAINKAEGREGR